MGLMIPIVHAARVRDARHAARLFGALGHPRVFTSGWRATTPADIDRLIAGALPGFEHTITVEAGTLDDAAFDALRALTTAGAGYLDIGTTTATLRVWPGRAWMHGMRTPPDTIPAILGIPGPLKLGTTTLADVTIKRDRAAVVPFDVATTREDLAFQLFRACAEPPIRRGLIGGLFEGVHPLLARFLHAAHATISADLELDVDAATALVTALSPDDDHAIEWDRDEFSVTLPSGEISTHLLAPVRPADEAAWHAQVTDALARAGA